MVALAIGFAVAGGLLLVWPVVGGLIFLAEAGTAILLAADAAARSNGGLAALPVTLTLPMIILLITEHYALKAARSASGAGGAGGAPA
jgi:hypothetical protein